MPARRQRKGRQRNERQKQKDSARQVCLGIADGEPLAFIEGHDDAIVGVAEVDGEPRVVYDIETIVRELIRRDNMDRDGAIEFFEYNIASVAAEAPHPLFIRATLNARDVRGADSVGYHSAERQ
jgi:hypothetical protein